jgi:hypothetical protein
MYGMLRGLGQSGMKRNEIGIFEQLMDAKTLFLTASSTTIARPEVSR